MANTTAGGRITDLPQGCLTNWMPIVVAKDVLRIKSEVINSAAHYKILPWVNCVYNSVELLKELYDANGTPMSSESGAPTLSSKMEKAIDDAMTEVGVSAVMTAVHVTHPSNDALATKIDSYQIVKDEIMELGVTAPMYVYSQLGDDHKAA